jgi:hypothetical protein
VVPNAAVDFCLGVPRRRSSSRRPRDTAADWCLGVPGRRSRRYLSRRPGATIGLRVPGRRPRCAASASQCRHWSPCTPCAPGFPSLRLQPAQGLATWACWLSSAAAICAAPWCRVVAVGAHGERGSMVDGGGASTMRLRRSACHRCATAGARSVHGEVGSGPRQLRAPCCICGLSHTPS